MIATIQQGRRAATALDHLGPENRGIFILGFVSVVIPARNEQSAIGEVVECTSQTLPDAEIIVVDDGSDDRTAEYAESAGATVLRHNYPRGNGAAIKTGARAARSEILVFMDGDGQHDPRDIPRLLSEIEKGFDLVIGARVSGSQANRLRALGNTVYNWLASMIVGHRVEDLTSGFRAVRAGRFREFLSLLPNGFSYPTTSTMAFYRSGYGVTYTPIKAAPRVGTSHLRLLHDGARFFLIIFRVATLYSPLKIFFPLAVLIFLMGVGYAGYTLVAMGRFTNFGGLLFITSMLVFLIGLVSEQIAQLLYRREE